MSPHTTANANAARGGDNNSFSSNAHRSNANHPNSPAFAAAAAACPEAFMVQTAAERHQSAIEHDPKHASSSAAVIEHHQQRGVHGSFHGDGNGSVSAHPMADQQQQQHPQGVSVSRSVSTAVAAHPTTEAPQGIFVNTHTDVKAGDPNDEASAPTGNTTTTTTTTTMIVSLPAGAAPPPVGSNVVQVKHDDIVVGSAQRKMAAIADGTGIPVHMMSSTTGYTVA